MFKHAEIIDFAAPHGVFSVARRFDPELDADGHLAAELTTTIVAGLAPLATPA